MDLNATSLWAVTGAPKGEDEVLDPWDGEADPSTLSLWTGPNAGLSLFLASVTRYSCFCCLKGLEAKSESFQPGGKVRKFPEWRNFSKTSAGPGTEGSRCEIVLLRHCLSEPVGQSGDSGRPFPSKEVRPQHLAPKLTWDFPACSCQVRSQVTGTAGQCGMTGRSFCLGGGVP